MAVKYFKAPLQLKADGPDGSVQALFSVYNDLDSDQDVVLPTFFEGAGEVPMAAWGHDWDSLPPAKGSIRSTPDGAVFDAEFFTDTTHGRDHYLTIKHLGDLQEWSFGFRVLDSEKGTFKGQPCRYLKRGEIFEVSPVLVGANRNTRTLAIKSELKKPWDAAYINDLPDSAFAVILSGGEKDDSGKTTPRSLRKLPHHSSSGAVDAPHLRNALSRLPQSKLPADAKTKAQRHLDNHAKDEGIGDAGKGLYIDEPVEDSYEDTAEDIAEQMIAQGFADQGDYVCTIATFPTYAYVSVCDGGGMGRPMSEPTYYRVEYTLDDTGDPVLANLTEVEPQIVFQSIEQPGIQYAGHSERLLVAVRAWTARSTALAALRGERKEGRTFSAATVSRMTSIAQSLHEAADAMDTLLGDAAPKEPAKGASAPAPDIQEWLAVQGDALKRRLQELSA